MARITVEDCVDKIANRFELVLLAAHRARTIAKGSAATVGPTNDKNTVIALREIADGLINDEMLDAQDARTEDERLDIPFTFAHEGSSDL